MSRTTPLLDEGLTPPGLGATISPFSGVACRIEHLTEVGGGSISRALIARTERALVRQSDGATRSELFVAEADGLAALPVPRIVRHGISDTPIYLVLELLQLSPLQRGVAAAGRSLAELHRIGGDHFG